jgi:hypothetical protein
MQRLNWKQMAAVVGAACLVGGAANGDALAAIVSGTDIEDVGLAPDQIRISLDKIGVYSVLRTLDGTAAYADVPERCTFDSHTRQRVCSYRGRMADVSAATAWSLRSRTGATQSIFDPATTDTVIVRTGVVSGRGSITQGRADGHTLLGTRRYAGVSDASRERTLDGADTTYRTFAYSSGRIVRNATYITYSNVTVARPVRGTIQYPSSGVVHAVSESLANADSAKVLHGLNIIVYFDGTRTPEAYIRGHRYTLDLASGIATPKDIE